MIREFVRRGDAARHTVLLGIPHRAWPDRGDCMGSKPIRHTAVGGPRLDEAVSHGSLSSTLPASTGVGA